MLLLSAMALGLVVESSKTSTDLKITRDTDLLGNETHKSAGPGHWTIEHCTSWHRPNHLFYQLGNAFFLLAFVAPHGSYGMLWLRCSLVIGCILLTMWGWIIECTGDVVLWSSIFLATNFVYLIILLCRLRPVRLEKEIESIYSSLFQPLRVSRYQFKKILSCMKLIRSLRYQEVYGQEKVSKIDSLSLVLSGKLVVSQNQKALHIVFSNQFLDSPEWFGVSTDDFSQVSITAIEESRVLIWHRDKLKLSMMEEPFLQTVFDHILSRDVVKKLIQVTQNMNEEHQTNNKLKRKEELNNPRVMKHRKNKRTESQQLNSSILQNKEAKENNAEQRRAISMERSRRVREKKRLDELKSVHHDSQTFAWESTTCIKKSSNYDS